MAVAISTLAPSTMSADVGAQQVETTSPSALKLTAQNFNIPAAGPLRFVFSVTDTTILESLLSVSNSVVRLSLGTKVSGGEQEVREIIAEPSLFTATDTLDFSIKDLDQKPDGQFEVIAQSTDLAPVVASRLTSGRDTGRDTGVAVGQQTDPKRIGFAGAGVYPVRIEILISQVVRASQVSFVNRFNLSTRLEPMPVSFVATLGSTNTLQPDGSHKVDDMTREKISKLIALLELDSQLISTQLSPQVIDGLSKSKDPIDQDLLLRLNAAIGQATLVDSTYLAFDPSSAQKNNRAVEFKTLLELGKNSLSSRFASSAVTPDVWIASTPLDQLGVDLLSDSGYTSVVMLPKAGATLGVAEKTARPFRLVSKDKTLSLYVADNNYAIQLGDQKDNSFITASAIAAQLLALRDKIESDGGTPSLRRVMLTTQDGSVINSNLIHEVLLILKRVPQQIAIKTLADLPPPRQDAIKPNLRLKDSTQFKTRMSDIDKLRSDLHKLDSTLDGNSATWTLWNERLMVMSSDTLSTNQRNLFSTQTREELKKLRTAVTLEEGTTFTLGSKQSQLQLNLQNSSNEDLTVLVKVESQKLQFANPTAVVRVPASSSNGLTIDVVALSNGLFPVDVRIFTADGSSQLGKKIAVSARVNALAGLGQVFSGVALLLLLTWWAAHFRRKYRTRISDAHPVVNSET